MKPARHKWIHQTMQVPETQRMGRRTVAAFSAPYPAFSERNQDAMAYVQTAGPSKVLIVADGVGGLKGGDKASALVVTALHQTLRQASRAREVSAAVLEAVFSTQKQLRSRSEPSGTTVLIAEFRGSGLRCYHAGDSDLLILNRLGKVKFQTLCHSPTGYLQAAGALTQKKALLHPDRPYISNYLGAKDFFLQVGDWIQVSDSDRIVLGSDGLFDNLSAHQIARIAKADASAAQIAERLVLAARKKMDKAHLKKSTGGKADDLSLMVLR
jgi:PPM family protein phosphatase